MLALAITACTHTHAPTFRVYITAYTKREHGEKPACLDYLKKKYRTDFCRSQLSMFRIFSGARACLNHS